MKRKLLQSRAIPLILFTLFSIVSPFAIHAQETSSTVTGIVKGSHNEPLASISIIVRNKKTNFTAGAKTDSAGVFNLRVPPGGPYSFSFSMIGYDPQTLSGYTLKEGTTFSLAIDMKPASGSLDQVVVTGV